MLDLSREQSFASILIGDIAQRAGVGYATFFRHYRDKDALLADVAEDFISDTIAMLQPLVRAADSSSAALALCRWVERRRPICVALLVGGTGNAVRAQILARAIERVDLSETARTSWLPESLGPGYMVTSILTLLCWWLEQGRDRSAEEMSVIIDRLVLTPALIQMYRNPMYNDPVTEAGGRGND
ncbi:TetR/AcrR family transcriptional regulator [uncultured Sphingomonas sp.]|uniref:TetR/AcrR family transcriptional regulator n=1 Tax=uncultured Sphingomonas sp. TaxID=158754 RepID=UPI0035CC24F4